VRCTACGLEYFTPLNPGDADFYASLSTDEGYYDVDEKWEFQLVAGLLAPGDDVLDVGCGDGVFLRTLAGTSAASGEGPGPPAVPEPRPGRTVGLDLNPWAIQQLRSVGIEAHCASIGDFAVAHAGEFDVVVMFQVVEHLAEVVPHVRASAACVRPGGRLVVSVPNRDRFRLSPHDPWDFPPHHVSRWGPDQLVALGRVARLDLVELRVQRRGVRALARDGGRAARRLGRAAARLRRRNPGARDPHPSPAPRLPGRAAFQNLRTDHTMFAVYRSSTSSPRGAEAGGGAALRAPPGEGAPPGQATGEGAPPGQATGDAALTRRNRWA
jgi:SAM-dependent methyltransferase